MYLNALTIEHVFVHLMGFSGEHDSSINPGALVAAIAVTMMSVYDQTEGRRRYAVRHSYRSWQLLAQSAGESAAALIRKRKQHEAIRIGVGVLLALVFAGL